MKHDEYAIMYRVEDSHWWYHGLRGMLSEHWQKYMKFDSPRILDAGCGTGAVLEMFATKAQTVGIDFASEALEFCRLRGLSHLGRASIADLPFADAAFDAVVSCDVLCHQSIPNKQATLTEIARTVKPGGLLFLNLPAYQWLMSSHDTHVLTNKRFSRSEVVRMLDVAGCDTLRSTYWNTCLFPPVLLTRLWRKIRPLPTSDLDGASGESLTSIFRTVLSVERACARLIDLPFGLSIFVVAQKRNA
ncbi:MAG: class I SAM-dependent methyltransferase [Candidatus Hydrogenedentes bacterium]|nr:class I SAM-dependent methyltransferase [Candidatus Hydrogenedentota bacterium]